MPSLYAICHTLKDTAICLILFDYFLDVYVIFLASYTNSMKDTAIANSAHIIICLINPSL